MEFWGEQALPLLDGFAARLGLGAPDIPWITARDRIAEFLTFLALVTGTLAKIGNEVFELQRPEIGEVGEPIVAGTVGSITMPHKRNPEFSEQLDTLARVVRADADVALEGLVALHERDGRSWKAEWLVLPEACQLTGAALGFGARLLEGLRVDAARMRANLDAHGAAMTSEPLMAVLAARIGKHSAHDAVYAAAMAARDAGTDLGEQLVAEGLLTKEEVAAATDPTRALGAVGVRGPGDGRVTPRMGRPAHRGRTAPDRPRQAAPGAPRRPRPAHREAAAHPRRCRAYRAAAGRPAALFGIPRIRLGTLPTPCCPRRGCRTAVGVEIWFKRDDLTGLGLGGNKVRGLEFLLADALAHGCDTLVTGGGPGSNWAMLAALAARTRGLDTVLVCYGDPVPPVGNMHLATTIGADIRFTGDEDRASVDTGVAAVADELRAAGRTPYPMGRGGATAVGALGYLTAARELAVQLADAGCVPTATWLATGSCGTQAGLVAGAAWQRLGPVVGVTVSRPADECVERVDDDRAGGRGAGGRARPGRPADRRRRPHRPGLREALRRGRRRRRAGGAHRGRVPRPDLRGEGDGRAAGRGPPRRGGRARRLPGDRRRADPLHDPLRSFSPKYTAMWLALYGGISR